MFDVMSINLSSPSVVGYFFNLY